MTVAAPSQTPLVSVVIPAYNAAATLAATLDTVLAQSHPRLEVVVVDDGSTDATPEVLAGYGRRIVAVRQQNRGLAGARNAGWRAARGELVAIMDADDLCAPERVSIQVQALQHHPEAVLCASDFSAFDATGRVSESHGARYYSAIADEPGGLDAILGQAADLDVPAGAWPSLREPRRLPVRVGLAYPRVAFGNFVHPPTILVRREAFDRAGPFDETFRYSSDWEWIVRVARLGPFVHVDLPLLDYRLSRTQMSATPFGGRQSLDILAAGRKIWSADPSLASDDPGRMRRCRREFYQDAAYNLSEDRKALAAGMLARSLWNGAFGLLAARIALRIAVPGSVARALRAAAGRGPTPG
jgi:glycosyltransferase involved in cell wall biosynthesis